MGQCGLTWRRFRPEIGSDAGDVLLREDIPVRRWSPSFRDWENLDEYLTAIDIGSGSP